MNKRTYPLIYLYTSIVFGLLSITMLGNYQIINHSPTSIIFAESKESVNIKDRNTIFFTTKDGDAVPAAINEKRENLFISPRDIEDISETYEHLRRFFPLEKDLFFSKAERENDAYELIATDLSVETADAIRADIHAYDIPGIEFEQRYKRIYPQGSNAAHILGFLGFSDNNKYGGRYGLEYMYDQRLSTKKEQGITPKGLGKFVVETLTVDLIDSGSFGSDIHTTIEPVLQKNLNDIVSQINKDWNSAKTGGIIINPQNGAIYALSVAPSFDSNLFSSVEDHRVFNNSIIEDVYEVGSVFKPITIAIGLDSNSIDINDTYNDTGSIEVDSHTVTNFDKKARGEGTTIQDILSKSLNIGAAFVVQETGKNTYKRYIDKFHFDSITRLDLPRETGGFIDNLNSKSDIEYITASYGHGIAVTPIGAARALSSIANGGHLIQPHIISHFETGFSREESKLTSTKNKKIFKEETTEQVTELLVNAYDKSLLGGTLKNPFYTIAGKTGTALLVDEENGGYHKDKTLHSFFGYFPASNPEFLVFLFTKDPKNDDADEEFYASNTLAVPFDEISDFIISYYALSPDRVE